MRRKKKRTGKGTDMKTAEFYISGMVCYSCAEIAEKIAETVPGAAKAKADYITETIAVTYDEASFRQDILEKMCLRAGFRVSNASGTNRKERHKQRLARKKELRVRIYISLLISIILNSFPALHAAVRLILATGIMWIVCREFLREARSGLETKVGNMSMLVFASTSIAFLYSVCGTFFPNTVGQPCFGSIAAVVMILLIGRFVELSGRAESIERLERLQNALPETICVLRDGEIVQKTLNEVETGDLAVVKGGERIPGDGVIVEGSLLADESVISGEFYPVVKKTGDSVTGASLLIRGSAVIRLTEVRENSFFSRLMRSSVSALRDRGQSGADALGRIMAFFVPAVFAVAVVSSGVWYAFVAPGDLGKAVRVAVSVMMVACPCAFSISAPLSIANAMSCMLGHGIFVADLSKLLAMEKADTVVLDKTGTVMEKEMRVASVSVDAPARADVMPVLCAMAKHGAGPLYRAVAAEARNYKAPGAPVEIRGGENGVEGDWNGKTFWLGEIPQNRRESCTEDKPDGRTLYFAADGISGTICVTEEFRAEAIDSIRRLHQMNRRVAVLSGDKRENLRRFWEIPEMDEVYAEMTPEQKRRKIREMQKDGAVIMVGDGINDIPAAMTADIGITLGDSCEAVQYAADIVIGKSRLTDIPILIRLSAMLNRNIWENLVWAAVYNAVGILLAVLGVITPVTAGAAMSISSVIVVMNAERVKKAEKLWRETA